MPPKAHVPFPEPAATLPGEADILASVLANLADDTAKLVYADWLDDHDDPRGKLLRDAVNGFRVGTEMPAESKKFKLWEKLVGIDLMRTLWRVKPEVVGKVALELARPALLAKSTRVAEAKIPVGASRLGGGPDLPPNAKWPMFQGEPLAFLAQFNLGELATSPVCRELPSSGLISVFAHYDPDEANDDFPKGSWKLLYFPDTSKLTRSQPPEVSFNSCQLAFTETLSMPDLRSPLSDDIGFNIDSDAGDYWQEVIVGYEGGHRLLGYPQPIQGDVLYKKTTRHLLTISGDEKAGWEWGDGGALDFTMSEADLKAHRFDRVKMEMQCG
ncbi:MAG: DUF1963 domain-containing protein [Gemmataceae bacterium]